MRYTLNRKLISFPFKLKDDIHSISVKISWNLENVIIQTKPESDEVLKLSKTIDVPMRQLLQVINEELEKRFPIGQKLDKLP